MISQNLENFKSKVDELIDDAMGMSRANDGVDGISKPQHSIHMLRKIMVTALASVAKALLIIFALEEKNL